MGRKKMTINPTAAEEAPMTTPTDVPEITDEQHEQNMLESSLGTAEMTDEEAIETLVRTDEEHLSDEVETPKQVGLPVDMSTPGTIKKPTQGKPGMFHVLSEIDDGVFVAWDRCHNGTSRHSIADCKCKGGPTEPPYVTKWRQEWIEKRTKAQVKAVAALKKEARQDAGLETRDYAAEDLAQRKADARQIQENEALAATVSHGIDTAKEAVQAAATEEVPSDES